MTPRKQDNFEFLEADNFIQDLQNELYQGTKKVIFIYFKIIYKDYFKKILPSLISILDKGGEVDLYLDAVFSKHNLVNDAFLMPAFGKSKEKQIRELKKLNKAFYNLQKKGARIHYFNEPKGFINKYIFPFFGRDHRKFIFLEKENSKCITYFGACNLDEGGFHDFMLKNEETEISQELLKNNLELWFNPKSADKSIELNNTEKIMIDSGHNFRSTIYNEAFQLIKNAKKQTIFVSQIPPEPHLLYELVLARLRNVEVDILIPEFLHKQVSGFPYIFAFLFAKIISLMFRMNLIHTSTGFTHAKILICDEVILLGSHNLSFIGVAAGTMEMSLKSKSPILLKKVLQFVESLKFIDRKIYN